VQPVFDSSTDTFTHIQQSAEPASDQTLVDPTNFLRVPAGSDPLVGTENAATSLTAAAEGAGATGTALASIEAAGTILTAVGYAGLVYAAYESYLKASGQINSGDYAGAAQTMADFAASVAGGLIGAEAGAWAGSEIGGAIGGSSADHPVRRSAPLRVLLLERL
jgi:hypothetical protein